MTRIFEAEDLSKSYPGVKANDNVSFGLAEGEIHALLGENGSGKSTLVKTIYGLLRPDSGRMEFLGRDYAPQDPKAARAEGVAMVFQHFSLFEALTVAENISLGMAEPPKSSQLSGLIRETAEAYGLPLEPDARLGDLSAGERQRVEIVRCLLQNPRLLIMDEPTSVLTPQEAEILFGTLRKLAEDGTSILYISHKLEEIRALCTAATILRAGRVVETCDPRNETARRLAEMMVGSTFKAPTGHDRKMFEAPVLEVENLSTSSESRFGARVRSASFKVRAGEILGIGGVAGNGQEELVAAISGEGDVEEGRISLNGREVTSDSINARRRSGLLTAPEERMGHAAVPDMNLSENALLSGATRQKLVRKGIVSWRAAGEFAKSVVERFDVRTTGVASAASSLSGGNLQKFVIGREIMQMPEALVVNQPTWGVDAAAAAAIRQALLDLASDGSAVVAISQDLDELIEISDSIAVLNEGGLSEARPNRELTREEIGLMMGGAHGITVAEVGSRDQA